MATGRRAQGFITALIASGVLVSGCGSPARSPSPVAADPPSDRATSHDASERSPDSGSEDKKSKPHTKKRAAASRSKGPRAYVSEVIDGDTIEVRLRGRTVDVRLIGIDTPESVHPSEPDECFGHAASTYTTQRLEGRRVRLEFDVERLDRYDRTLAYVWVGGVLFNKRIVRDGFAQIYTYPPNVKYADRILKAQRRARQANRGLWKACPANGTGATATGAGTNDGSRCTAGYSRCLPPADDYDCEGGAGDGPKYARGPIRVTGDDPYELDADGDGVACD